MALSEKSSGTDREPPLAALLVPSRADRLPLLLAGFALLLPILTALGSLRYATDDYFMYTGTNFNSHDLGYNFAGSGRPGQALLSDLLFALGATPPSGPLFTALQLLAFTYVGWLICGLWRVEGAVGRALVVVLHGAHPFYAELYTYSMVPIFVAVAITLAFAGIAICPFRLGRKDVARFLLATAALVASLTIYQLFFAHVAIALAIMGGLAILRQPGEGVPDTLRYRLLSSGLATKLLAMVAALGIYSAGSYAYLRALGFEMMPQGRLMELSEASQRVGVLKGLLKYYLFAPNALFRGPLLRLLLALLVVTAIAAAVLRLLAREKPARALFGSLLVVASCGIALCFVPGISMVSHTFLVSPRILCAVAVLVAGYFALGIAAMQGLGRKFMCGLGGVIAFAFLGIQNGVLIDQQRLNLQDQLMASQIVARLEELEEFSPESAVALIGGRWDFRQRGVKSALGNLNVSAHVYEWSKIFVLNEVSGYPLQKPTPAQLETAEAAAAAMPEWPLQGSVRFVDGVAVVKLPTPR